MTAKNPVRACINRVFLCLLFFSNSLLVQAATPLQTHNLNPLTLVYGLPLVSPARLSPLSSFSTSLNVSNTINAEDKAGETLFIDGETTELNLIYSFSFNSNTSFRIVMPFIKHQAGSLDSFIDDFHQTFGFPEGDRPEYPTDQFLFLYQLNSNDVVRFDQPNSGLGDIKIETAYQLYDLGNQVGSLWSSLKLPTGDSQQLTGSDRIDVAVWYAAENNYLPDWSYYYNLGLLLTGKSDIIPNKQNTDIYFGSGGIEWRTTDIVTLNIQLDFHSAFYQSNTTFLGDSVQISSGGHIKVTPQSQLEIVVVEDIYVGASPDVTFQLGYTLMY